MILARPLVRDDPAAPTSAFHRITTSNPSTPAQEVLSI